jgi:hypothetical protein
VKKRLKLVLSQNNISVRASKSNEEKNYSKLNWKSNVMDSLTGLSGRSDPKAMTEVVLQTNAQTTIGPGTVYLNDMHNDV